MMFSKRHHHENQLCFDGLSVKSWDIVKSWDPLDFEEDIKNIFCEYDQEMLHLSSSFPVYF